MALTDAFDDVLVNPRSPQHLVIHVETGTYRGRTVVRALAYITLDKEFRRSPVTTLEFPPDDRIALRGNFYQLYVVFQRCMRVVAYDFMRTARALIHTMQLLPKGGTAAVFTEYFRNIEYCVTSRTVTLTVSYFARHRPVPLPFCVMRHDGDRDPVGLDALLLRHVVERETVCGVHARLSTDVEAVAMLYLKMIGVRCGI